MAKKCDSFLTEILKEEFNGCPYFDLFTKKDIGEHEGKTVTLVGDVYEIKDKDKHYYAFVIEEDKEAFFLSGGAITKLIDLCLENGYSTEGIRFIPLPMIKTKSKNNYRPIKIVE